MVRLYSFLSSLSYAFLEASDLILSRRLGESIAYNRDWNGGRETEYKVNESY